MRRRITELRTTAGLNPFYYGKINRLPDDSKYDTFYSFMLCEKHEVYYKFRCHPTHGPQIHIYAEVSRIKAIFEKVYPDNVDDFEEWGGNDTESRFSEYGFVNNFETAFKRAIQN